MNYISDICFLTKEDLTSVYFTTNTVTICLFVSIFLILFLIGYIARAKKLYDQAENILSNDQASNAYYPIINVMTLGMLAGCNYTYALIATVLFIISIPLSAVLFITKLISFAMCIGIIVIFYLLYSTCHTIVLKKYMNKFDPDVSDLCIIVSGYVPFLKYYIHAIK